ncbi:uncharacterized protein LOC129908895 [Episyrphus balteatus]|uniref:uncharacterized protein LOC129908895 n=1 Tax=Episyrphus balteatus TaxID=286459 RepID=UPI0024860FD2|nr:uncharacterized protein LOC129908895 [Episyrphus balteatus]
MISLVGIFITLVSVAVARPGLLQSQTSLETIGSIVNHIPTSITHQSRTEIHNQQPVISQIIAPVLRTIPVQTILQETPIIASQIQSSAILDQEQQSQTLTGEESIVGEQSAVNDQRATILQNQGSLIGGQRIIVGENRASLINDQDTIVRSSGLLTNAINASGLQLNGIKVLSK